MAHKLENNKAVVDWTTGDPEGDRITLLAAYRDFIKEVEASGKVTELLTKWRIDTENQIDDVPRVWIKRPE